jgi:hypothetical protein
MLAPLQGPVNARFVPVVGATLRAAAIIRQFFRLNMILTFSHRSRAFVHSREVWNHCLHAAQSRIG